jgi:hypothetical protein
MNQSEPGVTALLRQLGADTTSLIRSEIALAKLEAQDVARTAAVQGARVGAAIALAAVGGLALIAWLILAAGHLIGDHYATAAALIGILFVAVGGVMARSALRTLRSGAMKPTETIATLQDDKRWAAQQIRELKRELSAADQRSQS